MSSTIGIGVPVPKMLRTWTLPYAAYLLLLSNRVAYQRLKHEKYLGDRLPKPSSSSSSSSPDTTTTTTDNEQQQSSPPPDALHLATRAHGNFLENVPLAFILAAVAELNGANRKYLHYAMALLLVLRIAHVEVGLKREGTVGVGRPVAFYGGQVWVAALAGYGSYLVKGYWGY
ncbi:hypothetical protein MMC24_003134 [Lignoscripta atroalba]|nr:hypothetical protein [Lignoscripta atroalba]